MEFFDLFKCFTKFTKYLMKPRQHVTFLYIVFNTEKYDSWFNNFFFLSYENTNWNTLLIFTLFYDYHIYIYIYYVYVYTLSEFLAYSVKFWFYYLFLIIRYQYYQIIHVIWSLFLNSLILVFFNWLFIIIYFFDMLHQSLIFNTF